MLELELVMAPELELVMVPELELVIPLKLEDILPLEPDGGFEPELLGLELDDDDCPGVDIIGSPAAEGN